MSIPIQKEVTCGNCFAKNTFATFASAGSYGANDLDTRPQETLRNTMFHMNVQKCFSCGYCSHDITLNIGKLKDFVNHDEYQNQLNDSTFSDKANEYLCKALIKERRNEFSQAGWSFLHASWVCDDLQQIHQAKYCRTKAIQAFVIANSISDNTFKSKGEFCALIIDLYRRNGSFETAAKFCNGILHSEKDNQLIKILNFQKYLILKRDSTVYTIAEAETFSEKPVIDVYFKIFNFDYFENITINKFKKLLGYRKLYFNALKDRNGDKSDVFCHFDNEDRVAVLIDQTLITSLNENEHTGLNIRKYSKKWKFGTYTTFEMTAYIPL